MITLRDDHPLLCVQRDGETTHLDVRPFLEAGGLPYSILMDCLNQLGPGERLVVHLPFEGEPLAEQARRLGFRVEPHRVEPAHWQLRFTLPG